jgi:LysR family nitrogen assimilation transcriptional regulator
MELRQLKYFIAVADSGSISAAARTLHVVQSAVSRQVTNLEAELEAKLFDRSKAGVKLTLQGQVVYRHALAVLKHVSAAALEIKCIDDEIWGKVAVGVPNSTAAVLGLPLLKAVREKLPHVEISLHEGLSGLLGEHLAAGRLDFSILFDTEPRRGFVTTPLFTERLQFVSADPEMLQTYAGANKISLKDVMSRPLILPPQSNGIRMLLDKEAMRASMTPKVIADITGVATMLAAVQAGLADSVMMAVNAMAAQGKSNLLVLPIVDPVMTRQASLVEPAYFSMTTAATCVKTITLQLVSELIRGGNWPGAQLT